MKTTNFKSAKISRFAMSATLLILCLALTVLVAGCGGSETTTAPTQGTTAPAVTGYTFDFKGTALAVNAPAAAILDALGEPINFFEADSCAFQGKDKIYTFAGMEFQTYTESESKIDYIYSISILDDTVETPEGIALGATLDDVKAAYGTDFTESANQLLYTKGNCQLKFVFDDGALVSVVYTLVT